MKKVILSIASALAAVSLYGGISAHIFTAANTPSSGVCGEVVGIEACSTNATGTAQLCAVTDLAVGGSIVSFTNCLSEVTLAGGIFAASTNGVFVATKQRVIVSGTAFPGGAITVWLKQ